MKTKITNIATLCTWSPEENKLLSKKDVEILIEDSTIIQIDSTVGDAEVEIDADIELLIPDEYVNSIQERLKLYTELDLVNEEKELENFKKRVEDRFGPLPDQVNDLFSGVQLREICKELGFERLSLKNKKMRCFFIRNAQSPYFESDLFNRMTSYISSSGNLMELTLKQTPAFLIMIKEGVKNLKEAKIVLQRIKEDVL